MTLCLKATKTLMWVPSKCMAITFGVPCIPRQRYEIEQYPHCSYAKAVMTNEIRDAKPFTSIPGPQCLPLIGTLYTVPKTIKEKNNNEIMLQYNKKYGPLVREQFGPRIMDSMVSVFDVDAVETLHRHDGKYPRRITIEAWQSWRDDSPYARGILIEDGPNWKRVRVLLDKQMLRPRHVTIYAEKFGEVAADFIERLRKSRDQDNNTVNNISKELFYWSLESIGTVLYETRFGGLSEHKDPEMQNFIQAVHNLFNSTNYLFYLPTKLNKIILPKWQKMHDDAWSIIFKQGKKQIDKKCMEIEKQLSEGKEVSGFLSTLIASSNMSQQELYSNISELMAAAVDTTSNTMMWVIYELSRNPMIQSTLRDEILSVVSKGSCPNAEQIQKMPYLKAFIKEILRLYPVVSVETRVTNEDLILCGYHIPQNIRIIAATYLLGRNAEYYPDPLLVKPERWIRNDDNKNVHSFAWLPFGYGTRMCIGRRVAELEMYILTSTLLQEFIIKPTEDIVNPPVTKPLLTPERPLLVQFVDY